MQFIPYSVIECSVFHAVWRKGTLLNAVNIMQHDWMQWIPCSMIDAVDFIQHGPKHSDWMQWIPCSVIEYRGFHSLWLNGSRLYAVESMERDCMHCIPFSVKKWNPIECSGFHAAWLNAVDFMKHAPKHPDWMQWIPCSVIECSVIRQRG